MVVGTVDYGDSTKAEVMGLIMGLQELKKLRVHNVGFVEGDSKVVVGWGLGHFKGAWK